MEFIHKNHQKTDGTVSYGASAWLWAQPEPNEHAGHEAGSHDGNPELAACPEQDDCTDSHQNGGVPLGPAPHTATIGPVAQHDAKQWVIPQPFMQLGRTACGGPCRHQDEHGGRQAW